MPDDIPDAEKWRRFRLLEEQHERISGEINARYLGESVEVLFEEQVRGRWRGGHRQPSWCSWRQMKNYGGQMRRVQVTWSGPWSMQARLSPPR